MKRYPRAPNTEVQVPDTPFDLPEPSELDIEALLAKSGEILRREVTNLMAESSSKKLSANSAKDLVAYVKLLHELKEKQDAVLQNMTDAELRSKVDSD